MARRATYVVDGRFFAHYFWKVEGTVRIHVNSRVAPVHSNKRAEWWGGGPFRTWGALVAILDLMSSSHLELLKMAAS